MHFKLGVLRRNENISLEQLLMKYDCSLKSDIRRLDEDEINGYREWYIEENVDSKYKDFNEFLFENTEISINSSGNYVEYYNKNARFDYWTIGGRWNDALITKDGNRTNHSKLKDIDWDKIKEDYIKYYENMYDDININNVTIYPNSILDLAKNNSKEDFIEKSNIQGFNLSEILTEDGEWLNEDSFNDPKEFEQFYLDKLMSKENQDLYLTIVDVHY